MRKILPTIYPSITSWTWHANLFSILEQFDYAKEWIFSNYIQIHCRQDIKKQNLLFLEFIPGYNSFLECPVIHTQYMDRKTVLDVWKDVKNFLRYSIDEGYYIYCICNERYLFRSEKNFFHELFIYGYDDDNDTAYVADFSFTSSGKYSFEKVSLDMVCKGIEMVNKSDDYLLRWAGGIILAQARECAELNYKLNIEHIKTQLTEYLQGVNSLKHLGLLYNQDSFSYDKNGDLYAIHAFGINVFQYLSEYLDKIENVDDIDIRPFHNLYDHKKLMRMRVEYLLKKKFLSSDIKIVFTFKEIEKKMDIVCKILLKIKVTNDIKLKNKVNSLLYEIQQMESEIIYSILGKL
ncbi:MAG: hypothetical protein HFH87_09810 [Lachnospiraceae bacterium]|nr:hypothetical protein [Lachnospiraceae bacterium]